MTTRFTHSLMITVAAVVIAQFPTDLQGAEYRSSAKAREFLFTYSAKVTNLDNGQSARVWIPLPPSNSDQQVTIERQELPSKGEIGTEATHGNKMLFMESRANSNGQIPLTVVFRVKRNEVTSSAEKPSTNQSALYLKPDAKVPLGGKPLTLLEGKDLPNDQMQLGRLLYDVVNGHMRYSKEGTGW